jgi:hypothetical protein
MCIDASDLGCHGASGLGEDSERTIVASLFEDDGYNEGPLSP